MSFNGIMDRERDQLELIRLVEELPEIATRAKMERCTRCVLSEAYCNIRDGLCEYCRYFDPVDSLSPERISKQRQELDELLKEHSEGSDRRYDALILFSGGKDSALLLQTLQENYPSLRLVALYVDNGFNTKAATENCERALRESGTSSFLARPSPLTTQKLFRHCALHLGDRGAYEVLDRADGELIFDVARNFAAEHKIPLILAGLSREQCEEIVKIDTFAAPSSHMNFVRDSIAGFRLDSIFASHECGEFWNSKLFTPRLPQLVFPLFCWSYSESRARTAAQKLKIQVTHPLLTNHRLIPLILAVDYARFGYCSFEPEIALLLRRDTGDRQKWLEIFQAAEVLVTRGEFARGIIQRILESLDVAPSKVGLGSYSSL